MTDCISRSEPKMNSFHNKAFRTSNLTGDSENPEVLQNPSAHENIKSEIPIHPSVYGKENRNIMDLLKSIDPNTIKPFKPCKTDPKRQQKQNLLGKQSYIYKPNFLQNKGTECKSEVKSFPNNYKVIFGGVKREKEEEERNYVENSRVESMRICNNTNGSYIYKDIYNNIVGSKYHWQPQMEHNSGIKKGRSDSGDSCNSELTADSTTSSPQPKSPVHSPLSSPDVKCKNNSVKYKTVLCKNFETYGVCKYGQYCQYAHGKTDLRQKNYLPENYQSKLCHQFHKKGYCNYGKRCQFLHTHIAVNRKYRKSYVKIIERNLERVNEMLKTSGNDNLTKYVNIHPRHRLPVFVALTSE